MEITQKYTVLGKFHAFLRWKGHVYRQLFYVTNVNASPNLLSRDGCYTLGVLKPCYSVETTENSSKFQGNTKVTPTQPTTHLDHAKMQGDSFLHCQNEGTVVREMFSFHQVVNYKGAILRQCH